MTATKWVNSFTDNQGRLRHYFRAPGRKGVEIKHPKGSSEFMAEHARLLATAIPKKNVVTLPTKADSAAARLQVTAPPERIAFLPGSIGSFIALYLASAEYRGHKSGTRRIYTRALQLMRDRIGAGLLADLDADYVDIYSAEVAAAHTGWIADMQVNMLSVVWDFARGFPEFKRAGKTNPTVGAIKRHTRKVPHKAWPAVVQRDFLAAATPNLVTAYMLLLYTGQRRVDVANMRWADYDQASNTIAVVQEKTGEALVLAVHRELAAHLATLPRTHDHILTTQYGNPYAPDSITVQFKQVLKAIGASAYCVHGLRKNAGVALAEAGCSAQEIMAVLGHRSPGMALFYCREAGKTVLGKSAMAKWEKADDRKRSVG